MLLTFEHQQQQRKSSNIKPKTALAIYYTHSQHDCLPHTTQYKVMQYVSISLLLAIIIAGRILSSSMCDYREPMCARTSHCVHTCVCVWCCCFACYGIGGGGGAHSCNRERQTCHAYAITVSRLLPQSFRRSQSDYYYILRSQFKRQKICGFFSLPLRFIATLQLLGFAPPYTIQPTIQKNIKQTLIHQQEGQTTVRIQKIKTKIKHTSVLGNTFNNRCK